MKKGAAEPAPLKLEKVSLIKDKIKDAKAIFFTDFTGLTVYEITALRRALRDAKAGYFVVKNRLARLALKGSEFSTNFAEDDQVRDLFTGATGLAIGFDDPLEPGRILKKTEKIKVRGALIENRIYRGKEYEYYVSLPPRPVLLTQLVMSINQPIVNLVYTLNGLISNLVYGLEEIRKKKTGGSDV